MHTEPESYTFRNSYRWYYQIGYTKRRALWNAFLDTKIGIRFFG